MTTPAITSASSSTSASAPASATTTRVCIKNLHPSFDETKLKSHLRTAQPTLLITDCKLLKTKDGRSRNIAFVGFQSPSQAEMAVSYFNRSFAGTARLSVSLAFSTKKKPPVSEFRPWSKHSEGSSRNEKLQQQQQKEQQQQQHQQDKSNSEAILKGGAGREEDEIDAGESDEAALKRKEFLSAMGVATSGKQGKVSKSKFWANDDALLEKTKRDDARAGLGASKNDDARPEDESEDDDKSSESNDKCDKNSGSSGSSDSESNDGTTDGVAAKQGAKERIFSDLDFLRSKQVDAHTLADESNDDGNDDSDSSSAPDDSSSDGGSRSDAEDKNDDAQNLIVGEEIAPQGSTDVVESSSHSGETKDFLSSQHLNDTLADRLFVRNLPFMTTEEDLFEKFSDFGHVTSVHIPVDDTKRNKGYAFINFEHKDDAKQAMDTMDGEDFQGRLIHILPSRPAADQTNGVDDSELTYKERQDMVRQKESEKSSQSWSASFLRGDAVVDNLSDRLGMSKGNILNVKDGISSGNAAVRLALGETHIISENLAFFEIHGVDITALDVKLNTKDGGGGAPKRSKTMILVKNLPYETTLEDLTKVFHDIGGDVPQKVLIPPSKTAALVEYGHPNDARRAFRKLAYKKFKHVPLYLEWAPMKAVVKPIPPPENTTLDAPDKESKDIVVMSGLPEEDDTADTGASQTIYVKNLNFSTSEVQLQQAFAKAGIQPRAVKIPTKAGGSLGVAGTAPLTHVRTPDKRPPRPPMKKHGASQAVDSTSDMKRLSMGFGFVEFPSEAEALKAMKAMQGKVVDGHALDIKLSTKNLSSPKISTTDKPSKNTKLMIRNVPFEATRTELLQLFGSFGQLKKVRLPKKFDGTHRGFAFCEFVTSKEAQKAMTTLSRTHLYGRHLVLEWAEAADEDGDGKVDVEAIREKTKRDAARAGLGAPGKKGKHLKF